MGKRSRMVAARRKSKEESIHRPAVLYLRAAAFCYVAAMVSEKMGESSVIEWISEFFLMTEEAAAESIAIGRRIRSHDGETR
jgi:hypothetical protein